MSKKDDEIVDRAIDELVLGLKNGQIDVQTWYKAWSDRYPNLRKRFWRSLEIAEATKHSSRFAASPPNRGSIAKGVLLYTGVGGWAAAIAFVMLLECSKIVKASILAALVTPVVTAIAIKWFEKWLDRTIVMIAGMMLIPSGSWAFHLIAIQLGFATKFENSTHPAVLIVSTLAAVGLLILVYNRVKQAT